MQAQAPNGLSQASHSLLPGTVLLSVWAAMASIVIINTTCTKPHAKLYQSETNNFRSRDAPRPYPKKVIIRLYEETLWVANGAGGGGGGTGGGAGNAIGTSSGTGGAVERARSITTSALLGPRAIVGGTVIVSGVGDASWIGSFGSSGWSPLSLRLDGWNSTGSGDRRPEETGLSPAERILRRESRASDIMRESEPVQAPQDVEALYNGA
jgi:hypothetical protein